MKKLCAAIAVVLLAVGLVFGQSEKKRTLPLLFDDSYLGRLSANPYDPDSTSNQFGVYGSPYSSGRQSSSVVGEDGTYLGKLNRNPYDSESIANPYGKFGSPYSSYSINNPYGKYGSPYSPYSATNPYTTKAPRLFAPAPRLSLPSFDDYKLPSLDLPKLDLWDDDEP